MFRFNTVPSSTIALVLAAAPHMLRAQVRPDVMTVGPNVQVSKAFPRLPHYESLAGGDPDHPGRLLACSEVEHMDHAARSQHCYASFDAGKTWSTALELDEGPLTGDPAMTYGRGDTAFVTALTVPNTTLDTAARSTTDIYRSTDGGRTWQKTSSFPFIDREYIVVDKTAGKHAGRVYVNGVASVAGVEGAGRSSMHFYYSDDGGRTFLGPIQRATLDGGSLLGMANTVVLSDGTLVMLFGHIKQGEGPSPKWDVPNPTANATLQTMTSTDGGETFTPAVTVSQWFMDRKKSEGAVIGQLGLDPGSSAFKDRLYAVWPDAASGRVDIRFSYSSDKGKTWSAPTVVNDDRPPAEKDRGPDQLLPAVGVNKNGAVVVVWYDRRESSDNLGWKIRAATSLDGGETFSPSVVVAEGANAYSSPDDWVLMPPGVSGGGGRGRGGAGASNRPISVDVSLNWFYIAGGHTSGMAVDAAGVFHPVWVDNRTGVPQMWTAPITVNGTVEKHGAAELAAFDDVSGRVLLESRATSYDRATNTFTLTARLKNMGRDTVFGPLKARLVALRSPIGVPQVVGADNSKTGVGAIWDLSATLPNGRLMPGATGTTRTFTIHLSDLRPIRPGKDFVQSLLHFETRIYGRASGSGRQPEAGSPEP